MGRKQDGGVEKKTNYGKRLTDGKTTDTRLSSGGGSKLGLKRATRKKT